MEIGRARAGYAILVRIFSRTQELFSERDNVVSSEQFFLEDVRFVSAGGNLHDIIAVIEINFRFIADDDAFSFAGVDDLRGTSRVPHFCLHGGGGLLPHAQFQKIRAADADFCVAVGNSL